MDRRRFLSSTMLSGLGLVAAAAPAAAFTVGECGPGSGAATCRELAKHEDLVAKLDSMLAEKGLDAAQRKMALIAARCPFCGSLLVG